MHTKRLRTFFLLFFIIFISCEDFTSYKYEADPTEQGTRIYGLIKDYYQNSVVGGAEIKIGTNTTFSDNFGNYSIFVPLGVDEQRDKPVPISITANHFRTYNTTQVLYPGITALDFELEYLPPVIEEYSLFRYDQSIVCQAKITDFQGRQDIDSVATIYYYSGATNSGREELVLKMNYVLSAGPNSGYYQSIAPSVISGGYAFNEDIKMFAMDTEGYQTERRTHLKSNPPDSAIFPVSLYVPPTIDRAVLVPYNDSYYIAQVKVFDYQGFENISTVKIYMHYKNVRNQYRKVPYDLELVGSTGTINGRFENIIPTSWGYGWEFNNKYDIIVVDNEGNKTKLTQRVYKVKPDNYIFPPEHNP